MTAISAPPQPPVLRTPRKRSYTGFWLLGGLIVVIGGGWWWTHRAAPVEKKAPPPVPVLATAVLQKDMPVTISAIGSVEAVNSVLVRALASGAVTKVYFREGQQIKKGQGLFDIDPGPGQAGLNQALAALERDQVVASNARIEAKRYAGLLKQGFVTREQTEQYQATAAAQYATVAADQASIANARIQLGYTHIVSPIDGVAGALQINLGNLVKSADQTPMVVINQVRPIYVDFSIPEGQVDEVRRFQIQHPLEVTAQPHGAPQTLRGQLTFLDNAVDATTGTLKLKARFPNEDTRLVPGEYVDTVLTLEVQKNSLVVPTEAVTTGQQGTFVFVLQPDQTVQVRPIKVSRTIDGQDIVASGLKAGEQVITDGQLQLVPGAKVKLRSDLTPPASSLGDSTQRHHRGAAAAGADASASGAESNGAASGGAPVHHGRHSGSMGSGTAGSETH